MKILIIAPGGKMGKLVTQEALKRRRDFLIVGGLVPEGRPYVRQDMGKATGTGFVGAGLYDNIEFIIPIADAVIDFSTVESSMTVVKACAEYRKALVLGTTGFSEKDMKKIEFAATKTPILLAANTSKTVNLMYELAARAAEVIGKESDIEIVEMHDRTKLDAPSGTAKEMGAAIADVLGEDPAEISDYGRTGQRQEGHIGFHSVRAGDISSTHTVIFGMMGERLEITHRAYDWTTYAKGALDGALFLKGKEPGLYTFRDVLAAKKE